MNEQDAITVYVNGCVLYPDGNIEIVPGNVSYLLYDIFGLLTGWCKKGSIVVYTECKSSASGLVGECRNMQRKAF